MNRVALLALVLSACGGAHTESAPAERAQPSSPPARASAESNPILAAHDARRAQHCAPPLAWSDALARQAQSWADHLAASGCRLEHSQSAYGENLAAGTSGTLSPEDVVDMWYREVDQYSFAHGGFSMSTGHFTQLVWVGSTSLGCAMSTCEGMDVWVCNYDPPGNVEGEYRSNVLPRSCH